LSKGCQFRPSIHPGIDYTPERYQRGLDKICRHVQEGRPIKKERSNLFAISLKKLKIEIKILEATYSLQKLSEFHFLTRLYQFIQL
jgi:hypothetical protein